MPQLAILLIALLSFCPVALGAGARTLDSGELLKAAYPQWHGTLDTRDHRKGEPVRLAPIDLPDVAWPWLFTDEPKSTSDSRSTVVEIVPMTVARLDDRHAVMVTVATPLDSRGRLDCGSYGCQQAFGLYFFTRGKSGWIAGKRIEMAGGTATNSEPKAHVVLWPGHGHLVSIDLNFHAQGTSTDSVVLMGVESNRVSFFDKISMAWSHDSSRDLYCPDFLPPSPEPSQREGYDDGFGCRQGHGRWRIDGNAIEVRYEEDFRKASPEGRLLPLRHSVQTVRFVPTRGKLKIVSGVVPFEGF